MNVFIVGQMAARKSYLWVKVVATWAGIVLAIISFAIALLVGYISMKVTEFSKRLFRKIMVRINQSTLDMLNAGNPQPKAKKNKYNAVKEKSGGKTYDSGKEATRGRELKLQEYCGVISDLKTQIEYILVDAFEYKGEKIRKLSYFADFEYVKGGIVWTEDTKGFKTQTYKDKRKMLLSRYPDINFIET